MHNHIHWQDGALLTAKHFLTQDTLQQKSIANTNILPYQMSYGIVSLSCDLKLLSLGTVKIDEFSLYTKEKILLSSNKQNNHLTFTIEEDKSTPIISIYINAIEKSTLKDNIPLLYLYFYLSDKLDANAKYSFKICKTEYSNNGWEISTFNPALISCNSTTFHSILLTLGKTLISIKHYIGQQQTNVSLHQIIQIHIYEFESLLNSVIESPIHFHPYLLFKALDKLYYTLTINESVIYSAFYYNFYKPHISFKQLFDAFDELLKKPIKQQVIKLKRENNAYLAMSLHKEFLSAHEFFLVIKKLSSNASDLNIKHIKLCSISRNKHINQMSLSGVNLIYMPNAGIHQLNNPNIYKTFKLSPGCEWDYIILEKTIMFEAISNCDQYQFFIYYR